MQYLQRPEEGAELSEVGVTGGLSHPGGCEEPNSSPLKEQYVFLAAEPSLYPP